MPVKSLALALIYAGLGWAVFYVGLILLISRSIDWTEASFPAAIAILPVATGFVLLARSAPAGPEEGN